jgi:hypothetical protein
MLSCTPFLLICNPNTCLLLLKHSLSPASTVIFIGISLSPFLMSHKFRKLYVRTTDSPTVKYHHCTSPGTSISESGTTRLLTFSSSLNHRDDTYFALWIRHSSTSFTPTWCLLMRSAILTATFSKDRAKSWRISHRR